MNSKSRRLRKVISGGQTGVDQAALLAAIKSGVAHGGWCPAGRRSEEGKINAKFNLQETTSRNYAVRTERNVVESDGTLILYLGELAGGTLLTRKLAKKHGKLFYCQTLDSARGSFRSLALDAIGDWIEESKVEVLNVAGPRESSFPGIASIAEDFLTELFSRFV